MIDIYVEKLHEREREKEREAFNCENGMASREGLRPLYRRRGREGINLKRRPPWELFVL
jgi:hypothetical protein